jgi:peptidoglycan hydrolase-like protein with peptidoglycan-binding domain
MKTPHVVSRLTTFLIAVAALTLLATPANAAASELHLTSEAPLAKGTGYDRSHGSQRVQVLQRRLRLAGQNTGPLDGRFGPLTEAAVIRYQQGAGLATDGLVGPRTWTSLRRAAKALRLGRGYAMAHGSARVRRLQRFLWLVGARPGPIDGRFGPKTEAAVLRFQHRRGLATDGVAGTLTLTALTRAASLAEYRPVRRHRHHVTDPVLYQLTRSPEAAPVGVGPPGSTAEEKLLFALVLVLILAAASRALPRLASRWRNAAATAAAGRRGSSRGRRRRRRGLL